MSEYHLPVLAAESMEVLDLASGKTFVDATYGGGGHSKLMLSHMSRGSRLFAFDQDAQALANELQDERITLIHQNFRHLKRMLRLHGATAVDGVLADLGVSSHQLDEAERGFSYRFGDSHLDMRMNQELEKTAADILKTYSAEMLQEVFSRYGEVRNAKSLAQAIVDKRKMIKPDSVAAFLAILDPLIMGQRWRYLSQVFQALRIEVNEEMAALEEFLLQTLDLLQHGGRLVIITYHSLEDRMVKNFLKTGNISGKPETDFFGRITRPFEILTKKAVVPSDEEIVHNPRARSAKMRVGQRI